MNGLTRGCILGVTLVATACGAPTGPQEYRGIGRHEQSYPTEIVQLQYRGMVLDVSFSGPCRVRKWEVEVVKQGTSVEVIPYFTAIPSSERCASVHRFIEGFTFFEGDSARFVIMAEPIGSSGRPPEAVVDTVLPFLSVF